MNKRKKHWAYRFITLIFVPTILGSIFDTIARQTETYQFWKLVYRFLYAFGDSRIYTDLMQTLWRFALGFAIALVCAVVVGVLMGRIKRIENALIDTVRFLRPIPSAAIIPLAMLVISGIGNPLRIFVIAYGVFWPLLIHIYQASKDIDQALIDTGRTLGKTRMQIFRGIVLRAILPAIMTSSRIGLAIGLLLGVTSEMLVTGDPSGIGYRILDYERSFKHPEMLAAIVVLAVFGWAIDWAFRWIERKSLPWHNARSKSFLND